MVREEKQEKILNVHIRYYAEACRNLGIPYSLGLKTRRLSVTTQNGTPVFCYKASTPLNFQAAVTISKDKHEVHVLLQEHDIPTPRQVVVSIKNESLLDFFREQNGKVVIKPTDSHGGMGVTVLPKEPELQEAYARAKRCGERVVAESYSSGNNYRFLVLDGEILAVALRKPPTIMGDGATKIETLFEDFNAENKANGLPRVPDSPYTWDIVKGQGFSRDSIPPQGREILLRLTANLSLGGTVEDVTDECHDTYKQMAISAAKVLGLRLVGIDIIAEDLHIPNQPAVVLEANAAPGLRIHYKDAKGAGKKIAEKIMQRIVEL